MRKSLLVPILLAVMLLAGCGGSNGDFYDDYPYSYDPGVYIPPNLPPTGPPVDNGYPLRAFSDNYEAFNDAILYVDDWDGVLGNDDYITGDAYADFPFRSVQGGYLEGFDDGSFEYEPPFGFTGRDTFVYTLVGSDGRTSQAEVRIDVYAP